MDDSRFDPGYYIVPGLYPQNAANAKAVSVNYRTSASTAFQAFMRIDESQGGNLDVVGEKPVNGFLPVWSPPRPTRMLRQLHWGAVDPGLSTGSLSIQLSDAGCIGGRIVADTIDEISPIGTTK